MGKKFADVKHDDNNISKALKFAKRLYEKYLNDEFVDEEPSKKRFRESGELQSSSG